MDDSKLSMQLAKLEMQLETLVCVFGQTFQELFGLPCAGVRRALIHASSWFDDEVHYTLIKTKMDGNGQSKKPPKGA